MLRCNSTYNKKKKTNLSNHNILFPNFIYTHIHLYICIRSKTGETERAMATESDKFTERKTESDTQKPAFERRAPLPESPPSPHFDKFSSTSPPPTALQHETPLQLNYPYYPHPHHNFIKFINKYKFMYLKYYHYLQENCSSP